MGFFYWCSATLRDRPFLCEAQSAEAIKMGWHLRAASCSRDASPAGSSFFMVERYQDHKFTCESGCLFWFLEANGQTAFSSQCEAREKMYPSLFAVKLGGYTCQNLCGIMWFRRYCRNRKIQQSCGNRWIRKSQGTAPCIVRVYVKNNRKEKSL